MHYDFMFISFKFVPQLTASNFYSNIITVLKDLIDIFWELIIVFIHKKHWKEPLKWKDKEKRFCIKNIFVFQEKLTKTSVKHKY